MNLKVVSSSKIVLIAENVISLYVPSSKGTIGVLPQHAKLITTLEIGEVKVKTPNSEDKLVINGGIMQVMDDDILILADEASMSDELIKEEIEKAIEQAEKHIASENIASEELIQLEKKLRYEKFKQGIAG